MIDRARSTSPGARPALHYTPPSGWLNDPLAVTVRDGLYHVFYQAVPDATGWQPRCGWGHATTPDLVSWTDLPAALTPGDGDLGCWSGDICTPSDSAAVMFYTSVNQPDLNLGAVRTARPGDDGWTMWIKGETVDLPPFPRDLRVFRDPSVIRDGSWWRMLVGAGYRDGRAAVLTYVSADLRRWQNGGLLAERSSTLVEPVWTGSAWECPHLLAVGDRHVLIVSVWDDAVTHYVVAAVGSYRDGQLDIDHWTRLTFGPGPYAATSFTDKDGLPALLFWIRGIAGPEHGWAGALSIPYRLSLAEGRLIISAHPSVRRAEAHGREDAIGLDWAGPEGPPSGRLRFGSVLDTGITTLSSTGRTIRIEAGDTSAQAPLGSGPVQVLIDGPVIELCTGRAVIAVPAPAGQHPDQVGPGTPDITPWWP